VETCGQRAQSHFWGQIGQILIGVRFVNEEGLGWDGGGQDESTGGEGVRVVMAHMCGAALV
jgi:hypothetical protein